MTAIQVETFAGNPENVHGSWEKYVGERNGFSRPSSRTQNLSAIVTV
jgi:hypothetical protein